ncbi:hypothetical protein C725_2865 [Pacificimonas flava]|uniref:Uncharacterized protein n=2 Tax=Alphaproteobacteria TaxID=28211 RepID=M2U191_9SPHN|nr:hypothetical protein C725_2865 [Pacificimonas flava]
MASIIMGFCIIPSQVIVISSINGQVGFQKARKPAPRPSRHGAV